MWCFLVNFLYTTPWKSIYLTESRLRVHTFESTGGCSLIADVTPSPVCPIFHARLAETMRATITDQYLYVVIIWRSLKHSYDFRKATTTWELSPSHIYDESTPPSVTLRGKITGNMSTASTIHQLGNIWLVGDCMCFLSRVCKSWTRRRRSDSRIGNRVNIVYISVSVARVVQAIAIGR